MRSSRIAVEEPADDGEAYGAALTARRRRSLPRHVSLRRRRRAAIAMPSWLTQRRAGGRRRAPQPITPSRARRRRIVPSGADERHASASRRWRAATLVHRLMQSLPDIPPRAPRRGRAALSRAPGKDLDRGRARRDPQGRFWRCSTTLRFAPLFAPGSRAEVPIVGAARRARPVPSGVVDRLVVTPDAVLIADYKTNRPAPRRLRRRAATATSPSSRSIARCWRGSIRTGRCAPRCCGPIRSI